MISEFAAVIVRRSIQAAKKRHVMRVDGRRVRFASQ
jgi:hypothetical protein